MEILNVEIKARCTDAPRLAAILLGQGARLAGTDHQTDTYFRVPEGRLKLREGNIENALIHYRRSDTAGPRTSEVRLLPLQPGNGLRDFLAASLGVLTVVDKERQIFFIDNVKFHLDTVKGLGSFVEIEAIDHDGTIGRAQLDQQCRHYLDLLGIRSEDLLAGSYSDMLLNPPSR